MTDDLLLLWLEEHTENAKKSFRKSNAAYQSLKNRETRYARSIFTVLEVKEQVLGLWQAALAQHKGANP